MKRGWADKEIEILKDYWGEVTPHKISEILDRSLGSVRQKAYKLKLGPAKSLSRSKPWSKEEEYYLDDSWGTTSIKTIAETLNRSATAIQQKAYKMGLGKFLEAGDYITVNELVTRFYNGRNAGRSYFIEQWINKGLPYYNKKVNESSYKVINLDDFWKWAEANRTLIDFSKLEVNILGMEPDWLVDQRTADLKMRQFKTTPWTESEDKRLLSLLREFKYSYLEISRTLNRTEGAIKRRMSVLGYMERPVAMNKHNPWNEEDTLRLTDLFYKGYAPDIMTKYINRSAQAIRGKIERMIKDGDLEPRSKHRKTC